MKARELIQCAYVYPENSRERGRRCEKRIPANKSGMCKDHVSCGTSSRGIRAQIHLNKSWSIWS